MKDEIYSKKIANNLIRDSPTRVCEFMLASLKPRITFQNFLKNSSIAVRRKKRKNYEKKIFILIFVTFFEYMQLFKDEKNYN